MNREDCKYHGPDIDNELIVVEGLSAAANVRRARNSDLQAILALQGKPVNAAKASRARVEKSIELQALSSTIGCGTLEEIDLAAMRYKRIVLLFDPDADGIHCGALVQIYLQRYMPQLIEAGKVAVVRVPLIELTIPGHEGAVHAYSEQHYQKLLAHLEQQNIKGHTSQRYKGVASLSVELLREKCLEPETRNLHILTQKATALAMQVFGAV